MRVLGAAAASAGSSTVSGAGTLQGQVSGAGTSSGVAAVSGAGAVTWAGAASSAGAASVSGTGSLGAIITAAGFATGRATVTARAVIVYSGAGSSAGTSTVSGDLTSGSEPSTPSEPVPTPNRQDRLKQLIEADQWFMGVSIVTEREADPSSAIEQSLARLQFAVVIMTASAEPAGSTRAPLYTETLAVQCIQNVILDPSRATRTAIAGVEQVIRVVHNQPVQQLVDTSQRFTCAGHRAVASPDLPDLSIHQVNVQANVLLPVNQPEDTLNPA